MENSLGKNVLISSSIGGFAAFIFSLFYLLLNPESSFGFVHLIAFTMISIAISALVTIVGALVDERLQKAGIKNPMIRQLLVMVSAMIIVGLAAGFFFLNYEIFEYRPERLFIFVGLAGFLVAGIMTFVENKIWRMKQEVIALELKNKYLEEINHQENLLEETSKKLIVTQERNRMARELHDSIAQGLNGINYSINTLRNRIIKITEIENREILSIIDHLEETAAATSKELQDMIKELKPSVLEEKGLQQTIEAHCQLFARRQEIEMEIEIEKIDQLYPGQELAIYRIVQEGLANIQKHSLADKVRVILKEDQQQNQKEKQLSGGVGTRSTVVLELEDNGQGFDCQNVSFNGIDNMKSRALQNNGCLEVFSEPGAGTRIKAVFETT